MLSLFGALANLTGVRVVYGLRRKKPVLSGHD